MRTQLQPIELHNPLDQIIQTLVEGVAIADELGHLIFANHALEQLLGYGPGELLGRHWTILLSEQTKGQWESGKGAQPPKFRTPTESTESYETRLRRKDGTTVPVLTRTRPLLDGEQRPKRLFAFTPLADGHPVSTRNSRRSPLSADERSIRLRQGRHQTPPQLQEELASLGEHVSSIAHELRNPLTIILLQTRLLHKAIESSPQVSDSLTLIQDQARRIGRMVDDLLTFAGSRSPHLETTDVNALIRRTLHVQPSLRSDNIQIDSDLAPDLPVTQADPDQLNQAFVNLIHNAVQAMGAGRHPTERAASPGRLMIKTILVRDPEREEPRIQIQFADNGPGIAPDVMPHIFEPFYTTKKCGKGTGLGLSICERIAQEHGGRIWAENNGEGGATFVLELPVIKPDQDEQPTSEETPSKPLSSLRTDHRILVVDDEPGMAYGVEQILRQAGFWVTVATNGRQALSMLEKAQFDLIISDLNMPGLNGQQFYQRVADGYPHLASRIIFSTGDSGGRRLRSFLENSGSTCIGKPFKADELLHLVRKALQAN